MNNYFDLHFHPLAKNHLGKYDKKGPQENAVAEITRKIAMSKRFMDFTDEAVLRMLESQSSIEQLKKGKVTFGVAAISALEFGIASSKSFFADMMKNNLAKPIDKHYLEVVKEGEVSYLNLFLGEVEQYQKLKEAGIIKFFTSENCKAGLNDGNGAVNLVLGIEGGHNLCAKKIGNALELDSFENHNVKPVFDAESNICADPAIVLENLVGYLRTKGMDVLYLTLTHLTHIPEQHLATQAFGTKLLKHPSFYPFGNGLTDLGKKVVETAYGLKASSRHKKRGKEILNDKPVLIDIKHLSLKSRLDLYDYREANNYENIPLIATHVGVTGYSINDWKDNLEMNKCVNHIDQGIKTIKVHTKPKVAGHWGADVKKTFTYNPCTLNLMDEDILKIIESGGLIGVGLNVGLLGSTSENSNKNEAYEFLSTADFMTHFPYNSIRSLNYADAEELKSEETWLKPEKKDLHPLNLCFNIIHIMAVVTPKIKESKEPWDYICIGSDFDGFIETPKYCSDSYQMKDLEFNLLKWLPVAAKRYRRENGGTRDMFEFTMSKIKLKEVVEAILYENGRDFIVNYFASEKEYISEAETA